MSSPTSSSASTVPPTQPRAGSRARASGSRSRWPLPRDTAAPRAPTTLPRVEPCSPSGCPLTSRPRHPRAVDPRDSPTPAPGCWHALHVAGSEARVYGSVLLGPAGQTARQLRIRIQVLLTVLLVGTNLIGAVLVFVLSSVVIPSPSAER